MSSYMWIWPGVWIWTENVTASLAGFFLSVCEMGCWRNLRSVEAGQSPYQQRTGGMVWGSILVVAWLAGWFSHMPGTGSD